MAKWRQAPIIEERPETEFKWKQATLVSPEGVRPLQRQLGTKLDTSLIQEAQRGGGRWGDMPTDGISGDLSLRGLKQAINIVPNIAKKILSPEGIPNKFVIKGLSHILSKIMDLDMSPEELEDDLVKKWKRVQGRVPSLMVDPPEGLGEKVVDIGANVGQFVTELAVLKKVAPVGTSESVIWEMQNLMSGGKPGMGVAMHGAFTAPGKIIKGTTLAAKTGRVAAESAGLAGLTALEQKIDTGEIDFMGVATAAALPVALRTPKVVKALIRKRNPKVMKAITDIQTGKLSPIDTANKTVTDWSKKAQLLNKTERKTAVHKLRQQQHARYTAKKELELKRGASSFQAHTAAKKVRGGKAGTPEIEPLVLSPVQMEVYGRQIEAVYPKHKGFQRAGTYDAITKMTNGKIPTNYEFGLLEPVFGTKATIELAQSLKGKKGLELADIPMLIRDLPKALRFGFDPQAARGLSKMTIRHPLIYLSALGKNIRGIFSKKYADRLSTAIEKSPVYELGKKSYKTNYLSMKPWASVDTGTKLEQYGHVSEIFLRSKNRIIKGIGKWLRASERGANLGMNDALNKLVIKGEKDLTRYSRNKSLSEESIAAWRKQRGHDINIFTKRITARHPKIKALQKAANWLVFSPSYTASGLASGPQSFIKLATGKGFADRTYAMQIMLSRLAGLTAVSSMIGYVGYKWRLRNPTEEPPIDSSPNPLDTLFGKIRRGEDVYDLGFGDVADYRLMAHIGVSAHIAAKELLTGKQVTTAGKKKPPSAGEAFSRYLNSKRTLYITLGKQLLTGKDWLGNPVTLKDTALDNLPFEFFQAFVEAGEADGIWEDIANGMEIDATKKALGNLAPSIAALGGVGTGSYPVHAATTRYKFQDIIAEQKHNKKWDELSLSEQNRLKSEHKKQFVVLSEKVRKERIDVPFSLERIQKEETEANRRVTKMLSKSSRGLVKDIDLGVSRRPKNWYLNDKRYNRYQELVAQFADERLSKVDFTDMEDKRRVARVQVIVKAAKNKAFGTLRREIGR